MPSDVNAVDELDLPDLDSPEPQRARRRGGKGEQTRRAIAEAALRLFREQGYEATTMRAIAKEAGVATGNAYYYFGSEGARIRVPAGLRSRLPELLWLYSMGIVLYWVHDTSPGCEKTYRLIDVTAPLAERLVRLARLPVLRSMTRRLLAVLDEVLG
jgi:AcrR family transcriptional regulator